MYFTITWALCLYLLCSRTIILRDCSVVTFLWQHFYGIFLQMGTFLWQYCDPVAIVSTSNLWYLWSLRPCYLYSYPTCPSVFVLMGCMVYLQMVLQCTQLPVCMHQQPPIAANSTNSLKSLQKGLVYIIVQNADSLLVI